MVDIYKLRELFRMRPEVRRTWIDKHGNLRIIIRDKIRYYDNDVRTWIIEMHRCGDAILEALSNLGDITVTQEYVISGTSCRQLGRGRRGYAPKNAFTNPFCDMGQYTLNLMQAFYENDLKAIVENTLFAALSFNTMDYVLLCKLGEYWEKEGKNATGS